MPRKKRPVGSSAPPAIRPEPTGKRLDPKTTHRLGKGRPLLCTPELTEEFCQLVGEGMPIDRSADYLRIGRSTASKWLTFGRLYEENGGTPDEYFPYFAFRQEVLRAQAIFVRNAVKMAATQDKNSHMRRTKAWQGVELLKRRDRRNWSANETTESDDDGGTNPDLRYV